MKRLALMLIFSSCAVATPGERGGVGGGGGQDAGTSSGSDGSVAEDLAHPPAPADLAGGQDLWAAPDLAAANDLTGPQAFCLPRINEVMTGAPSQGTAEFVELYNPCAAAVDVSGWKIVYRAATNVSTVNGVDSATLYTFPAATSIPSHQFRVYGGSSFGGTRDGSLSTSMKDGEGAVGLRDAGGTLRDSIGYGTVDPANTFLRGTAAPAPPVVAGGGSIGRRPDGADSNDNGADFKVSSATSPGSANY